MVEINAGNRSANQAGEVVWINVLNAIENRFATGKERPAVLVRRDGGHWVTMGLTTRDKYLDGSPRQSIPNPRAVGLKGPGYLWGDRLTNVSAVDVGDHIGWVDEALAELIIRFARLGKLDASALRSAAAREDAPNARRSA